jgi:hypothetical protein
VVKCLHSNYEALSSSSNTAKKKGERERKKERERENEIGSNRKESQRLFF